MILRLSQKLNTKIKGHRRTIRWIGAKRRNERLLVGLIWLVLTVAFEVLFGRLALSMNGPEHGEDFVPQIYDE